MDFEHAYQTAKDFQTLIAALFAVGAAFIAYRSTQSAARKAQATAQHQITHALEKEDESAARRRIAFMIMIQTRLLMFIVAVKYRIALIESVKNISKMNPDGFTYDTATLRYTFLAYVT
jgi:hypothetical protein